MDSSMDMEQMGPQNFLYGCELKAGKEVVFNPEDDEFEHQLSLRMVCLDSTVKDELHTVEVEGRDPEGQTIKTVLATLRLSTLPTVSLGGFEITPPVVFRLKAGAGPVHISGQHLIMSDEDASFEEEEDDEEEEEEVPRTTGKRPAAPQSIKAQKKMKMEEEEEDDDDDDDEDDEDDDDEEDESEEEEETPVKVVRTNPALAQPKKTPKQNGKMLSATPTGKGQGKAAKTPQQAAKTPDNKGSSKKPQTPRAPPTTAEIKTRMLASLEKGVMLPKIEGKFENYVKNGFKVDDKKMIAELWQWRQTVKDRK
ncbi:nucleophosmin 1a isoform X2 [Amia ocellicauda]|uniref:nucleophosmin 1a isoform X2 n=1 Tax=Amia ocellicauda TaxID=2972642 RepID=UPI0034641C8C